MTDKLKINDLLNEIKENCTEIAYLSMIHLYGKLYDLNENIEIDKEEFLEIIKNYSLFFRYLNDYAGTIYKRYNSSIEIIYIELCSYYGLELDNEYRFEHILRKLEKQTPQLLMSLVDDDIQRQTVENFEEKLSLIKNSGYYKNNHIRLSTKIDKLEKNIALVKKALNFIR
ncbi:MAG: hypothetical protein L0Y61_03485 [Epsilonproteobacteria bacterium]|nr:hypothetical protein [Campylobacterota bacterium]